MGPDKVVLKRRFQATSSHVITQKTAEFSSTAAKAYDLANGKNPKKEANNYQPTPRTIPEGRRPERHRVGNLKSHVIVRMLMHMGYMWCESVEQTKVQVLISVIRIFK